MIVCLNFTIKPRFVFSPSRLENDLASIENTYKIPAGWLVKPKIIRLSDNRVNVILKHTRVMRLRLKA